MIRLRRRGDRRPPCGGPRHPAAVQRPGLVPSDIPAGAAWCWRGLVADGDTEVHDVFHIDCGYLTFVGDLQVLGAEVERVHLIKALSCSDGAPVGR